MVAILAVDDSVTIRALIEDTLREAGLDVTVVSDGQQALEAARAARYQMVLTDVHMPGLDGLQLVRELRALEEYRYVPILVITTEAAPEMKAQGKAAGATGWLVKPFDPLKLVATIRRVLR